MIPSLLGTRPGPRLSLHGVDSLSLRTLRCLDSFPTGWPPAGFLVPTAVSFQTLPFVARLNTCMGPGRTVVIKGEVNAKAKG